MILIEFPGSHTKKLLSCFSLSFRFVLNRAHGCTGRHTYRQSEEGQVQNYLNHSGPTSRNRVRSKVTQAIMAREIISIAVRKFWFLGTKIQLVPPTEPGLKPQKIPQGVLSSVHDCSPAMTPPSRHERTFRIPPVAKTMPLADHTRHQSRCL